MKKTKYLIPVFVIAGVIAMALSDSVFHLSYSLKSGVKLLCFSTLISSYILITKDRRFLSFFKATKKSLFTAFFLGISVLASILGGYFLIGGYFDFSQVTHSLSETVGVNKDNFLYVAIYISLVNSLAEEVFFRGFAFLAFKKYVKHIVANISSSLLFAVYHIAIISDWSSPLLLLFLLTSLFVGGLIFNAADDKCESIYPSWMIHAFSNLAINIIGCILFGII